MQLPPERLEVCESARVGEWPADVDRHLCEYRNRSGAHRADDWRARQGSPQATPSAWLDARKRFAGLALDSRWWAQIASADGHQSAARWAAAPGDPEREAQSGQAMCWASSAALSSIRRRVSIGMIASPWWQAGRTLRRCFDGLPTPDPSTPWAARSCELAVGLIARRDDPDHGRTGEQQNSATPATGASPPSGTRQSRSTSPRLTGRPVGRLTTQRPATGSIDAGELRLDLAYRPGQLLGSCCSTSGIRTSLSMATRRGRRFSLERSSSADRVELS